MKKVLLDTNAYVAFKKGKPGAIEILQMAGSIGICSVVLGELLSGFVNGSKETLNRLELAHFFDSPRVLLLPVDDETAEFYARIFHQLKRKGRPIPTNDLWIAAAAMQHGYAVFSYDKHFQDIENLPSCHHPTDLLP